MFLHPRHLWSLVLYCAKYSRAPEAALCMPLDNLYQRQSNDPRPKQLPEMLLLLWLVLVPEVYRQLAHHHVLPVGNRAKM
ncbi:hypothetical protein KUF71_020223 [Frankliniella fusca]|uniref:Uncharacterized protein n=1 Tax=Frankliniella fusca TaxID=407009 RepID=A0AAE1HYN4_9NEOP|nr:hypothetical protein KUF71_020223 [Frankliniella fusca]